MIFFQKNIPNFIQFYFHYRMNSIWDVSSLLEYQFFCCPGCEFKHPEKQTFVNHASEIHPEACQSWQKIQDESLKGLKLPWQQESAKESDQDIIEAAESDHEDEDKKDNIKEIKTEPEGGMSFCCGQCGTNYASMASFRQHLVESHKTSKRETVKKSRPR